MKYLVNNFFAALLLRVAWIILTSLSSLCVSAQSDFLQIEGLISNHQGLARWSSDGTGPEPAATGHTMINGWPATYYFSTVDYDSIDPQATSGFSFTGTATGFSNFINALSTNGFSFSDVNVKFGLYDLGNDIKDEDWWVNGNIETWKLESEQDILIQVNGEDMVGAPAPTLSADLDFGTFEWLVKSDPFLVEDRSATSSAEVQDVAAAFLSDLSGKGLILVRPMAPNTNETSFNENGRSGNTLDSGDWHIEMVVDTTITGIVDRTSLRTPDSFILQQNYPNPFNPSTNISYQLSKPSHVVLTIYNLLGQGIKSLVNEIQAPGAISVSWDGRNEVGERVGSGVYFYQLRVNAEIQIKKMLVLQ